MALHQHDVETLPLESSPVSMARVVPLSCKKGSPWNGFTIPQSRNQSLLFCSRPRRNVLGNLIKIFKLAAEFEDSDDQFIALDYFRGSLL